ncbi:M10 family metallopeptidase C-terminal domain-containing protein [Paracoccus tegillarcae]|nr:M10 family metallopeptidase C-terminal domain-containing protein [Paracoccus tegillarcae]
MRYVTTIHSGQSPHLVRITDLEVIDINGTPVLVSATYNTGGLATFAITDADLPVSPQASWTYAETFGHMRDPELVRLSVGGETGLTLVGLSNAAHYILPLAGDGSFGALTSLYADDRLPHDLTQLGQFEMGGQTYVYAARQGEVSFDLYREGPGGGLTLTDRSVMPGAATMPDASLDKIISVAQGGQTVLVAISGQGNFLSTQRIDAQGQIVRSDYLKVGDGTGFNVPDDVAAVTVAGQVYLIVTSNRSSSLTTLRLLPDGSMIAVDHVVDELTTRFQGATALATVEIDGRAFVFVGGTDDGITMFSLLPDGRLMHMGTLVDDDAMTLDNVSAITATEVDGEIVLFVSSATEAGITQIAVDPGLIGLTDRAVQPGSVEGSERDDMLRAGRGTTHLRGGAGDDVLITFREDIMLWGGAGRDVFVATPIDGRILIWDYNPDEDRLDLTQLGMIRSVEQLRFSPFSKGIRIRFGDTLIEIHSANGGPLSADQFTNEMFAVTHYTPPQVESIIVGSVRDDLIHAGQGGSEIYGRAGNDVLLGGLVEDLLIGEAGNDTISGGDGDDTLSGGSGNDRLRGGSGHDLLQGDDGHDMLIGDEGDDELHGGGGNDTLFGSAGNDSLHGSNGDDYLSGDAGDDWLNGNAGNDSISGGAGDDWLYDLSGDNIMSGGDGNDSLQAGDGNDLLNGGAGADLLTAGGGNDTIFGGAGDDHVLAGSGDDQVMGGDGNDDLHGGAGDDLMRGDAGDDTIQGGFGSDTLYGDDGHDVIHGDFDDDTIYAGTGNDWISGGSGDDLIYAGSGNDTVTGGAGHDTLIGGGGSNQLSGGDDDDLLQGDGLADTLWGDGGRDTLFGHDGADIMHGGEGDDMLFGGAGNDDLRGDAGRDLLMGGDGADTLQGQAGDDHLRGGDGNDVLMGGEGADLLWGGEGADRFVFMAASDSTEFQMDFITDFEHGADLIDLSALDLVLVGEQAFSGAGQLRVSMMDDHQLLQADLDGDGQADMVIRIDSLQAIGAADLLL